MVIKFTPRAKLIQDYTYLAFLAQSHANVALVSLDDPYQPFLLKGKVAWFAEDACDVIRLYILVSALVQSQERFDCRRY